MQDHNKLPSHLPIYKASSSFLVTRPTLCHIATIRAYLFFNNVFCFKTIKELRFLLSFHLTLSCSLFPYFSVTSVTLSTHTTPTPLTRHQHHSHNFLIICCYLLSISLQFHYNTLLHHFFLSPATTSLIFNFQSWIPNFLFFLLHLLPPFSSFHVSPTASALANHFIKQS